MKTVSLTILSFSLVQPAAADLGLAAKHHCLACHAVDHRTVGPSFKEIAKRYAQDKTASTRLSNKIKRGGGGAWGTLPMPPNPQLSETDVNLLVNWILMIK